MLELYVLQETWHMSTYIYVLPTCSKKRFKEKQIFGKTNENVVKNETLKNEIL